MSIILQVDGPLGNMTGTGYGGQVTTEALFEFAAPVLVEMKKIRYLLTDIRFLRSGWVAPASSKIYILGDGTIWGQTKLALTDVRRIRVLVKDAKSCPQYQILLQSGEEKITTRCNGSPFYAEVLGKFHELHELSAIRRRLTDMNVGPSEPKRSYIFLGASDLKNSITAHGGSDFSSFAVLTNDEYLSLIKQ